MDEFDPIALLGVLNAHQVRYVVIGGFAAVAYGSPLPTADVDIAPARDVENLTRLSAALAALKARVRVDGTPGGLPFAHSAASLREVRSLNLVTSLGELDLVMAPDGVNGYAALAAGALVVRLHEVDVPLASLDDVIASKEAAGRPKDRQALPMLRELRDRIIDAGSKR